VLTPFASVAHIEHAAVISEVEAAEIVSVQESDFIQRNAAAAVLQTEQEQSQIATEVVYLLQLSRTPRQMVRALTDGVPLQNCREVLTTAGHNWKLMSGAMVFVQPWQYRWVMRALNGHELKASHLIVGSSIEYLVEESIQGNGQGSWAKSRAELPLMQMSTSCDLTHQSNEVEDGEPQEAVEQAGVLAELVVIRTFLSSVPSRQDPGW